MSSMSKGGAEAGAMGGDKNKEPLYQVAPSVNAKSQDIGDGSSTYNENVIMRSKKAATR